jgi:hypothetical protein
MCHMRHIFLVLLAISVAASPVNACIIKRGQTDAGYFDDADEVFVGRIVKTELRPFNKSECDREIVDSGFCNYVIGYFELVQAIKGAPPRRGEVREFINSPGMCSLGLLPGWYYVFYTKPKENRMVLYTEGSFPLGWSYDERVKEIVQHLREQGHPRPKEDGA